MALTLSDPFRYDENVYGFAINDRDEVFFQADNGNTLSMTLGQFYEAGGTPDMLVTEDDKPCLKVTVQAIGHGVIPQNLTEADVTKALNDGP